MKKNFHAFIEVTEFSFLDSNPKKLKFSMSESDKEEENFRASYAAWAKEVPKIRVYMDDWEYQVSKWNTTRICVRCKK